MFDDRQYATGLPGTMIEGLQQELNLMVTQEITIYTGSVCRDSVTPYIQFGMMPCIGLLFMMILQGGASASPYIVWRADG